MNEETKPRLSKYEVLSAEVMLDNGISEFESMHLPVLDEAVKAIRTAQNVIQVWMGAVGMPECGGEPVADQSEWSEADLETFSKTDLKK